MRGLTVALRTGAVSVDSACIRAGKAAQDARDIHVARQIAAGQFLSKKGKIRFRLYRTVVTLLTAQWARVWALLLCREARRGVTTSSQRHKKLRALMI